jgi:hypothetical protein
MLSNSNRKLTNPIEQNGASIKFKLDNTDLTLSWDQLTSKLQMVVDVPSNQYFSIGFGASMVDTDMIVWQTPSSGPSTTDLWSTSNGKPSTDAQQDVTTTAVTINSDKSVHFTSERPLDTGDQQDFLVPLDTDIAMCYAAHSQTANFVYHD